MFLHKDVVPVIGTDYVRAKVKYYHDIKDIINIVMPNLKLVSSKLIMVMTVLFILSNM